MAVLSTFSYYISNQYNPVEFNSPEWKAYIPLKAEKNNNKSADKESNFISCGDYFNSARSFLSEDNYRRIISGALKLYNLKLKPEDIKNIGIYLIKHGEFYHPSKIEVNARNQILLFVLNIAVSEVGLAYIKNEYQLLIALNDLFEYAFIPKVISFGEVNTSNNLFLRMFLGEWFEEYYEFHLSRQNTTGKISIKVWDDRNGDYFLNEKQTLSLYEQITMILTCYYNLFSCHNVSYWHHAAGDFVMKKSGEDIKVKLITVRKYTSLVENVEEDLSFLIDVLLLFFLNLSIRIRLDRIDGTGEPAWSNDLAIKGIIKGFFLGLKSQIETGRIQKEIADAFKKYMLSFSENDILEISKQLVNRMYADKTREMNLIKSNIGTHVKKLYLNLNKILKF